MITIKDVSVITRTRRTLLHKIDATFPSGGLHIIIGPNGSGKTTLLKTMIGEQPTACGLVSIQGMNPQAQRSDDIAKLVSYVEADHTDPFAFSVLDVILWGRWSAHKGYPSKEDLHIATECAHQMGLSTMLHRSISSASTGERKKAHLARSLASQCPILCWDEPCGPLDIAACLALMRLLKSAANQGKTMIVTMHDLALAMDHADTITVLDHGMVAANGRPQDLQVRSAIEKTYGIHLKKESLLGCATLPV